MRFCYIPLTALAFMTMSLADDMTLRDGQELHGYKILSSGVDSVRILHDEGITTISASELTDEWQALLNMTPEEVDSRKREVARRNKEKEQARQDRENSLRQSLNESERVPRYLQGADITAMLAGYTSLDAAEAEAVALRWNIGEAKRVGLRDQASVFQDRLNSYSDALQTAKKKREDANAYWTTLQSNYEQLKASSEANIASLKKQVSSLKNEVETTKSSSSQTVVYTPPVYIPPPQPPVIITPPAPVRINPVKPVAPVRPINVTRPVNKISTPNKPISPLGIKR